ncbi:MAG: PAS domain S-box protein [Caulobacteraceae bacterium]|nr:PAS domain S-box protein [Caulobacteraceae bacterium]
MLLVNALSDHAILRLDADGRIVAASAPAEWVLGYRPDDLAGRDLALVFGEEGRPNEALARALSAARIAGRFRGEARLTRGDGARVWISVTLSSIRDAGAGLVGFGVVCRDETAEHARKESERRLSLLVGRMQDYGICLLSPAGLVTDWNIGAERTFGYAGAEIVGRHFDRFYTADDRQSGLPASALERARRDGTFESDGWRVRKDGGRFWAWVVINAIHDDDGELIGFANIVRDVTERRVAQEALRESERQFRLLVNGLADHAIYMLDPNGVIVSWNAGAERIKGYSANEVIGQHYAKFFTEDDRAAGLPARGLYAAMEHGRYEAEGWRVRKDGSRFWASVVLHAVTDSGGGLAGFAKITRDSTERRNAELELHKTQERLFHGQKLEALGQLTGGVAHDFNNLLMIIGGQAQLLKRAPASETKVRQAAAVIETATARGAALTRKLLSFARRQPLSRAVIDPAGRIEAFKDILAKSLGEGGRLAVELPSDLWPVEVDPNEFELALINLAVNARDAMPDGGGFSITGENVVLRPGETDADLVGEFVALSLADTGVGIPEDVLPKIFDPFFTTKQADKGTGLGLSQVYGFTRQAGGAASARSVVGGGTTITLYLPRVQGGESAARGAPERAIQLDGPVLVVDDNPDVVEVTSGLIELLGARVNAVCSAEAALAALEGEERYAMVITDVVLGGAMDGLSLGRALRERRPRLPVLLVSGYARVLNEVGETFPVLQKPFGIEDLERAVAEAIDAAAAAPADNVVRIDEARLRRGGDAEGR